MAVRDRAGRYLRAGVSTVKFGLVAARGAARHRLSAGALAADAGDRSAAFRETNPYRYAGATAPLWAGVVAASPVLVVGLLSSYTTSTARIAEAGAQCLEAKPIRSRTASGAPLGARSSDSAIRSPKQIAPGKSARSVAWTFRTGGVDA